MLADLELRLIELIKGSSLGQRLRQVDSLPDLDGDSLVGRFNTDAPAVYVALESFPIRAGYFTPKFGIACVARNSRGHQAARHGDGVQIGLYEIAEAVIALLDRAVINVEEVSVSLDVVSLDLTNSEAMYQKGLYAAVVQIQSAADVQLPCSIGDLSDFKTFHADFDIDPHQAPAEHIKWLDEPPDHSSSTPELSDTLPLQE